MILNEGDRNNHLKDVEHLHLPPARTLDQNANNQTSVAEIFLKG
jgi:hypothetical protein